MKSGFCICVTSICDGRVPVEFDETGRPVVYTTVLEAQQVVAEDVIGRLQQFTRGERDFEDAIFVEEYIAPVDVSVDGKVTMKELT